jgi:hypothetical protein
MKKKSYKSFINELSLTTLVRYRRSAQKQKDILSQRDDSINFSLNRGYEKGFSDKQHERDLIIDKQRNTVKSDARTAGINRANKKINNKMRLSRTPKK